MPEPWGRNGFDREINDPRACRRAHDVNRATNSTADQNDQQATVLEFPTPDASAPAPVETSEPVALAA